MKLAILAAFALPLAAVAQLYQGPKDFADIPWGTPQDAAKEALLAQPGVSFWKPDLERNKIMFHGGNFAGAPAGTWHLYFSGGKFARGLVDFQSGGKPAYTKLKEQLIAKYGRPKTEKTASGHTETIWEFLPGPDTPQQTAIHLELHNEKALKLWYHNATLWRPGASGGPGL